MKQIEIHGEHPAFTGAQIRAVVSWVLRQLEIPADVSEKWTVALGVSRKQYSGQGGGGCAILRFTSRPVPAEDRARDLVRLAAHEFWHNEQHRRNGWRWPTTASGRRQNMEPGARLAAAGVEAAFLAQEDALLARWGFRRGALLPDKPKKELALPFWSSDSLVQVARTAIGDHVRSCQFCRDGQGFKCADVVPLYDAFSKAKQEAREKRAAAIAAKRTESLSKARDAAKAAQAKKAAQREARVRAKLEEWERKLRATQAKVKEYQEKVRYYDAEQRAAAEHGAPGKKKD